ncbi:MAG: imm11 family protein [Planctomycetota bacterium]|jgi:hypothetical protein
MYYLLNPRPNEDGMMMGIDYEYDHPDRSWMSGNKFTNDESEKPFNRHPEEPIKVTLKDGFEDIRSHLKRAPLPLMSKQLLNVISSVGVDNIDTYSVDLYYSNGTIASQGEYFAFNLIGKVSAADLTESKFDENRKERLVNMPFESLAIDESKAQGLLMFRLAENVSAIIVHEKVKEAIEDANLDTVECLKPEKIALL